MTGGPQDADERRTSPVELLWDLVFVFAVTQVTTLVAGDPSWAGVGRGMIVLALVWWAWSAFAWAANAQDPDSPALRLILLAALLLTFVAGLALPRAFGTRAILFSVAYGSVRLLHLALYASAARRGSASLSAIMGFATTVVVGLTLLVAGAFLGGSSQIGLWLAALALDYAGPGLLTRRRLRGLQEVAVAHFAERYGLFVIICLGESLVAIGLSAEASAIDADLVVTIAFGLVCTIALWWAYFDRFATVAEARLREHADPVLAAADGYSYLHLVIVAGIILFAAGMRVTIHDARGSLEAGPRLALCGGLALYAAGNALFRLRLAGTLERAQIAAAVALVTAFSLGGGIPAVWLTAVAAGILVLLCIVEARATPRAGIDPLEIDRRPPTRA